VWKLKQNISKAARKKHPPVYGRKETVQITAYFSSEIMGPRRGTAFSTMGRTVKSEFYILQKNTF
jgi:hypothetical protein